MPHYLYQTRYGEAIVSIQNNDGTFLSSHFDGRNVGWQYGCSCQIVQQVKLPITSRRRGDLYERRDTSSCDFGEDLIFAIVKCMSISFKRETSEERQGSVDRFDTETKRRRRIVVCSQGGQ